MNLDFEITQGDSFYREIPFVDQFGAPVNLTGWIVQIDFKASFDDTAPLFSLTSASGLGFKNADPGTGVLVMSFDADYLSGLDISVLPRNGERVPFKVLVGDVKLTPPSGVGLIQGAGSRTQVFLKVLAGVTA